MKKILISGMLLCSYFGIAQEACELMQNESKNCKIVNVEDVRCIAENSENENTIFFTFGLWCSPCRLHLKDAIALKENYDVHLIILLSEKEDDELITRTIDYLHKQDESLEIMMMKDTYGKRQGQKYKNFLKEITPEGTKSILGMSKYIVLDKKGKVQKITTWKDNKDNDWQDNSKVLEEHVIPLLKAK